MSKDDLQRTIGIRVKAARNSKNLNQDELAAALHLNDRQTISDIENGKRAIKPNELVLLSDFLGKDIEFFIDPFNVVGEAKFSWRASNDLRESDLNSFEDKAGRWIGLLRWLIKNDSKESNIFNISFRITKNRPSYEDVATWAEMLVQDYGLGEIPAKNLLEIVKNRFNIHVIFVDTIQTPESVYISGASCYLMDLGVILVNRNEPESRRNFDLAHELFHILTWNDLEPAHRASNCPEERSNPKFRRIETLADIFASSLLMPQASIEKQIDKSKLGDIEYLSKLASKFLVSPSALGLRLFYLDLIDQNTVDQLKQERLANSITPKPFSLEFVEMLHASLSEGKLSARKAAKAMSLSLEQFKELFLEYSLECPFDL